MTATAAPNVSAIFDSIFKPTWLAIVHKFEGVVEPTVIAQAKADVQTAAAAVETATQAAVPAQAASATASTSVQAVLDQGANALVNTAVARLGDVPIIGPLIVGEAEAEADEATDAGINSLMTFLADKLSPASITAFLASMESKVAALKL